MSSRVHAATSIPTFHYSPLSQDPTHAFPRPPLLPVLASETLSRCLCPCDAPEEILFPLLCPCPAPEALDFGRLKLGVGDCGFSRLSGPSAAGGTFSLPFGVGGLDRSPPLIGGLGNEVLLLLAACCCGGSLSELSSLSVSVGEGSGLVKAPSTGRRARGTLVPLLVR